MVCPIEMQVKYLHSCYGMAVDQAWSITHSYRLHILSSINFMPYHIISIEGIMLCPNQLLKISLHMQKNLHPLTTLVVHPCSTESLEGAIDAANEKLINPNLIAFLIKLNKLLMN